MRKPILDRAEVALDFPEKYYYGSFDRDSTYDLTADSHGVHIALDRRIGERRHIAFHLHYYLLADIVNAIAITLPKREELTAGQWDALARASRKLDKALHRSSEHSKGKKIAQRRQKAP
ncbi:MAG TPA: hypothetical protein VKN76_10210 [Kiloniellaceae bacterium]|nr:hypothetical protein [Kiloniellaceae bacterium]